MDLPPSWRRRTRVAAGAVPVVVVGSRTAGKPDKVIASRLHLRLGGLEVALGDQEPLLIPNMTFGTKVLTTAPGSMVMVAGWPASRVVNWVAQGTPPSWELLLEQAIASSVDGANRKSIERTLRMGSLTPRSLGRSVHSPRPYRKSSRMTFRGSHLEMRGSRCG